MIRGAAGDSPAQRPCSAPRIALRIKPRSVDVRAAAKVRVVGVNGEGQLLGSARMAVTQRCV